MTDDSALHHHVRSALAHVAPGLDPDDLDAELALDLGQLQYLAASISLSSGIDIPDAAAGGLRTVRQLEDFLTRRHR